MNNPKSLKVGVLVCMIVFCLPGLVFGGEYLGNYSNNSYDFNSISNPYGAGSQYKPNGVNNPFSKYGSPYSAYSAKNPYATSPPRLIGRDGSDFGIMTTNPMFPDRGNSSFGCDIIIIGE